jgi:hypothetical protein
MKQYFFKIRSVIFSLAITGAMITAAMPAFANKNKGTNAPIVSTQPAVEIVGNDFSSSTFHVTFNAEKQVKLELKVRDENGVVLFKNTYETERFSRYIKLINDGEERPKLYFTIRVLPNGEVHTFDVSSNVKLVNDVIVTRQ